MSEEVERVGRATGTRLFWQGRSARFWHGLSIAVAAITVSVLFTASASAAPLSAGPFVTHAAPFKGTLHIGQTVSSIGCGASSSFLVAPKFNLTTGIGKVDEKAAATGCGLPGFSDDAMTQGIAGFDSKIIPHAGITKGLLAFNYSDNLTFNLSATPMNPAGGPFAWAAMQYEVVSILWNLTTMQPCGGLYSTTFDSTNFSASGYANGTIGGPSGVLFGPIVPNPNFQYVVMIYFIATIWVHAPAGTHTHASAKFDMATGSHKFTVMNWAWH
jgi:hypothetical protein